jgi:hypothetical protein
MLAKKLKNIGKACRKADEPVLRTLAIYLEHVGKYLRQTDDEAKVKVYGEALAQLNLPQVLKAHGRDNAILADLLTIE